MSLTRSQFLSDVLKTTFEFLSIKANEGKKILKQFYEFLGELFDSLDYSNIADEFQAYCANKSWMCFLKDESDQDYNIDEFNDEEKEIV